MKKVFEELGQIKSMLSTVMMNQSLILRHLFQVDDVDSQLDEIPAPILTTATAIPESSDGRKLSGMPKLTTMVDGIRVASARRTSEGQDHCGEDEETGEMATLQPMVKLEECHVSASSSSALPEIKAEPSEEIDDAPPQMELCL